MSIFYSLLLQNHNNTVLLEAYLVGLGVKRFINWNVVFRYHRIFKPFITLLKEVLRGCKLIKPPSFFSCFKVIKTEMFCHEWQNDLFDVFQLSLHILEALFLENRREVSWFLMAYNLRIHINSITAYKSVASIFFTCVFFWPSKNVLGS